MQLPHTVLEALPAEDHHHALLWWAALPPGPRLEFIAAWDHRADRIDRAAFVWFDRVVWRALPLELRASLVDEEPDDDARLELLDYFLNHESYVLREGTHHICTAHPDARAAVARGFVPPDFTCPLQRPRCPMRQRLAEAPGKTLRLDVVALLPWQLSPPRRPHHDPPHVQPRPLRPQGLLHVLQRVDA